MDMSLGKLWETVKGGEDWHATVYGAAKSQTQTDPQTGTFSMQIKVSSQQKPRGD